MAITVEQTAGRGIHATYTIKQDGVPVARITRFGPHSSWRINSVHYGEELSNGAMSIDATKQIAYGLTYPSKAEIFEKVCQRIEGNRRATLEHVHHKDFVRLAREIVKGSNSAPVELAALIAKIDTMTIDREDTHARWRETGGDHGPNRPPREHSRSGWFYPEPPSSEP